MKKLIISLLLITFLLGCNQESSGELKEKSWHTSPDPSEESSDIYPMIDWSMAEKIKIGMSVKEAKQATNNTNWNSAGDNIILFSTSPENKRYEIALKLSKDQNIIEDISYKLISNPDLIDKEIKKNSEISQEEKINLFKKYSKTCNNEKLGVQVNYPSDWLGCYTKREELEGKIKKEHLDYCFNSSDGCFFFRSDYEKYQIYLYARVEKNNENYIKMVKNKQINENDYLKINDNIQIFKEEGFAGAFDLNGAIIDDDIYTFDWQISSNQPVPKNLDSLWFPDEHNLSREYTWDILKTIKSIKKRENLTKQKDHIFDSCLGLEGYKNQNFYDSMLKALNNSNPSAYTKDQKEQVEEANIITDACYSKNSNTVILLTVTSHELSGAKN